MGGETIPTSSFMTWMYLVCTIINFLPYPHGPRHIQSSARFHHHYHPLTLTENHRNQDICSWQVKVGERTVTLAINVRYRRGYWYGWRMEVGMWYLFWGEGRKGRFGRSRGWCRLWTSQIDRIGLQCCHPQRQRAKPYNHSQMKGPEELLRFIAREEVLFDATRMDAFGEKRQALDACAISTTP